MTDPFVVADPDAQHYWTRVPSPIGPLLLIGRDGALTGLYMLGGPRTAARPRCLREPGPTPKRWLRRRISSTLIFQGQLTEFY